MLVEAAPNGDSLALALDLLERSGLITIRVWLSAGKRRAISGSRSRRRSP